MSMLSVVTWNVNSVRARLTNVLDYLRETSPDIVLLQETKVLNEQFPALEFEDMGYNLQLHGQKSYNGVAVLSKHPLEDTRAVLPGDDGDDQCRYLEAVVSVNGGIVRVVSVYVPNGQAINSDKWAYKLRFYDRIRAHVAELLTYEEPLIIGGDFNVAPEPLDVWDAKKLDGTVGFHPRERETLRAFAGLGLYDAFRVLHPDAPDFSWWDYRAGSFEANRGMRIDQLWLSAQAMDRLTESRIDADTRAKDKASDHAPVVGVFDF